MISLISLTLFFKYNQYIHELFGFFYSLFSSKNLSLVSFNFYYCYYDIKLFSCRLPLSLCFLFVFLLPRPSSVMIKRENSSSMYRLASDSEQWACRFRLLVALGWACCCCMPQKTLTWLCLHCPPPSVLSRENLQAKLRQKVRPVTWPSPIICKHCSSMRQHELCDSLWFL